MNGTKLLMIFLVIASTIAPVSCRAGDPTSNEVGQTIYSDNENDEDNGTTVLGEIVGNTTFRIVRRSDDTARIVVTRNGRLFATMQDPAVHFAGEDADPGETQKDYEFHFSPDDRYLFVQRGICNDDCCCYVFRWSRRRHMVLYQPHGMRFDAAAFQYYTARNKDNAALLGSVTWVTEFEKWNLRRDKVYFTMANASYIELGGFQPGDVDSECEMSYDFGTGRFRILREASNTWTKKLIQQIHNGEDQGTHSLESNDVSQPATAVRL